MPVQQIELEEEQMMEVSDEYLEGLGAFTDSVECGYAMASW